MEIDEDSNSLIEDEEIVNNNNNNDKRKSICDSYYFVFTFYLIESLISFAAYYLFYRFQIGDKNNIIYKIIIFSLSGIILIFYIYFSITFQMHYANKTKFNDRILFVLINIFKICFFLFVYLMTVLTGNNRISYPHFEARAYWKISICFLYLLLIFYQYFKKDKYSDKIYAYIIIAVISLLIYLFLTLFTQRKLDNWDRFWIYLIFTFYEISLSVSAIYLFKNDDSERREKDYSVECIGWRINLIDLYRYYLPAFFAIYELFKFCLKKLSICKKIKKNFS